MLAKSRQIYLSWPLIFVQQVEDCAIGAGELAPLFGVDELAFSADLPVKLTHSDFNHLIVPIRNLVSIQHVRPDFIALTAFCRKMQVDTVALFTTETLMPESSIHCRDFCPAVGTPEASATGTTNRALACYLVDQGLLNANTGTRHTVIAEQGYEMGRPSQIRVEMTIQDGQPVEIMAGGVATKSIEGIFLFNLTLLVRNLFTLNHALAFQVGKWRIFRWMRIRTTARNAFHRVIGSGVKEKRDRVTRLFAGVIVSKMFNADKVIVAPLL